MAEIIELNEAEELFEALCESSMGQLEGNNESKRESAQAGARLPLGRIKAARPMDSTYNNVRARLLSSIFCHFCCWNPSSRFSFVV